MISYVNKIKANGISHKIGATYFSSTGQAEIHDLTVKEIIYAMQKDIGHEDNVLQQIMM